MKPVKIIFILLLTVFLTNKNTFAQQKSRLANTKMHAFFAKRTIASGKKTRATYRLTADSSYSYNSGSKVYNSKNNYKYNSTYGFDITPEEITLSDGHEFSISVDQINNNAINTNNFDTSFYSNSNNNIQYIRANAFDATHNTLENGFYSITNNVITPSNKNVYTLNANKNISQELNHSWLSGSWAVTSKNVWGYNSNNLCNTMVELNYNNGTSTWDSTGLFEINYNANNKLQNLVYYERNAANTAWNNSERYTYTYIGNNIATFTTEFWDGTVWNYDVKETSTYNANNQLVNLELAETNLGVWVTEEKVDYTYNNVGDKYYATAISQTWDGTNFLVRSKFENSFIQPDLVSEVKENKMQLSGAWKLDFSKVFLYNNYAPTAVKNTIINNLINVYPNPATAVLQISNTDTKSATYAIYNTQGGVVTSGQLLVGNNPINISNFANSNYLLLVNGKFVKMFTKQ